MKSAFEIIYNSYENNLQRFFAFLHSYKLQQTKQRIGKCSSDVIKINT